jgi:predicted acylesterase/phospholipase RssA
MIARRRVLGLLAGGGARGALQVGVIERVAERATAWCGTSVGAVNGSAAAARRAERVRELWESVEGVGAFQARNLDVWDGLYHLGPLRRLMQREGMLAVVDPLWVGVFDYGHGTHELVRVDGSADRVWACVQASSSQPVIHEAVELDGRWVGDGGILAPMPPVPPGDWNEVHAVFCVPIGGAPPPVEQTTVSSALEQAARAIDVLVHRSIALCVDELERYARAHPATRVFVYSPASWAVVGPTFDADRATIRRRLEHGEVMAQNPVEL